MMKTAQTLLSLLAIVALTSCGGSEAETSAPTGFESGPAPVETQVAQNAIATIREIQGSPVWVQSASGDAETEARVNQTLNAGAVVRTEGDALVQINLDDGRAFRLGNEAKLTLQSSDRLQLERGEIIAWIASGTPGTMDIEMPAGTAGIRGTTVFAEIPAQGDAILFSWEGTVSFRPRDGAEELLLAPGEEVQLRPGNLDPERLRRSVRRLPMREWMQRRRQSRLLNGFRLPMPTIRAIENAMPSMDGMEMDNGDEMEDGNMNSPPRPPMRDRTPMPPPPK
jgi:hypothetical protein